MLERRASTAILNQLLKKCPALNVRVQAVPYVARQAARHSESAGEEALTYASLISQTKLTNRKKEATFRIKRRALARARLGGGDKDLCKPHVSRCSTTFRRSWIRTEMKRVAFFDFVVPSPYLRLVLQLLWASSRKQNGNNYRCGFSCLGTHSSLLPSKLGCFQRSSPVLV